MKKIDKMTSTEKTRRTKMKTKLRKVKLNDLMLRTTTDTNLSSQVAMKEGNVSFSFCKTKNT